MIQFYAPDIALSPVLPESDSAHAVRVLRMQPGDPLQAVDGKGGIYSCRLLDANPRRAVVEVVSKTVEPQSWKGFITVAVAPTKHNDRMEWLVEKLTEIGVNRIVPVLCRHSERREIKQERLVRTAVSAMKQSLKATLPEIVPMTPLAEVLAAIPDGTDRFVAYCDPAVERRDFSKTYRPGADTFILIGPEGDFSPGEIESALNSGFIAVTLGEERLRTETAALYAVTACHAIDRLLL